MERRLWERVRWGNVARAFALVAVVALVVAWPVVAPEAPRVPAGAAAPPPAAVPTVPSPSPSPSPSRTRAPASAPAPAPWRRPGKERVAVPRGRRAGGGAGRTGRDTLGARVARPPVGPAPAPAPHERAAPVASPAPAIVPQGVPAPADPDPVVREFSFEAG